MVVIKKCIMFHCYHNRCSQRVTKSAAKRRRSTGGSSRVKQKWNSDKHAGIVGLWDCGIVGSLRVCFVHNKVDI